MKTAVSTIAGLVLLVLCGCSDNASTRVAPYSGVVRLDDQPLPRARIMFVPLDQDEDGNLGSVAYAESDEDGRFTLTSESGDEGGSVGRNSVWVSQTTDGEESVPPQYNQHTELVVEVPEEGAEGATLNLYSHSAEN